METKTKITDQIKTWEDICQALTRDPNALPDVSMLPEKHQKFIIASIKLTFAAEVLNEGWEPDYNDEFQKKWYNWFWIKADQERPSGFGFSSTNARWTRASTIVGARLSFKSEQLAVYCKEQFKFWYLDMLLINT